MMIFITARRADKYYTIAFPDSQIYSIYQQGALIQIRYNNGEMEGLGEELTARPIPRTETVTVKCEDVEGAVKTMRQFYKACESRQGAFCFASF